MHKLLLKNTNLKANLRSSNDAAQARRAETPKTNGSVGGGGANFLDELRKKVGPRNREENIVSSKVPQTKSTPNWKQQSSSNGVTNGTKTPTNYIGASSSPSASHHNLSKQQQSPVQPLEATNGVGGVSSISPEALEKLKQELRKELQDDFRRIIREELKLAFAEAGKY